MRLTKKICTVILCLVFTAFTALTLTACGGEKYENGVLYNGTAVIGADQSATSITVKDGTTTISAGAFSNCKSLTEVMLPDSINEISQSAFDGCDALIKAEGGVYYVGGWVIGADKDVTEITVKDGTRGIAREAFSGCTELKTAVIPDSVKHIGARAFFRCPTLESLTLPFIGRSSEMKTSMHFGYIFGAFNMEQNSEYVPDSLTEVNITSAQQIAEDAFSGCAKISTVTLPQALKSIGSRAFYECTALSAIDIPDTVTSIGDRAFYKCSALVSIRLPENDSYTYVAEYTFAYCSSIKELTVPRSVKEIGACALARCLNLERLTIEATILNRIGQQAFDGCKYLSTINITARSVGKAAFQNCIGLTEVTLGLGTREIDPYAFNGCSGIVSFSMPKSVSKIGEFAFYACHSLRSIELGDSITAIERSTFQNCINLEGPIIPSSVKSVGQDAFSGCNGLTVKIGDVSYVDGWVTDIQPSVTTLELSDSIAGIADGAFTDAVNLERIVFTGAAEEWELLNDSIPASVIEKINVTITPNKT